MNRRWMTRLTSLYLVFFVVSRPYVQSSLLGFVFSGVVPGTTIVVPFWAMLIIYLVTIVGIVMHFFGRDRTIEPPVPRARMPRRRYSHI